ncbi:hypothetical protein [Serratia ureilytica]|uniref:hypothetical protein n=1 Tax=Serratia ureilytica TaxID=300181 RepID=UPI0018D5EDFF|nr:hypothetical protein [Serratia ureilytica]MBH2647826.1 hypothetical protein [Serratia ureilytica]
MPYSRESKENDTHAKGSKQDNANQECQLASQGGAAAAPPEEGLSAGSSYERLFAFIREAHLEEAQEFRLKGYNSQVPEVDEGLLTQLRDDLATAKSRLCLQVCVGGPLGSLWLLDQIGEIERLTSTLSDDVIKHWIEQELIRKNTAEAAGSELGSRRTAQSLARRLESTLQTLIRVVHTLRAMDDYSTPEKRHDMLVAEITGVFSSYDKSTVIQALGSMTAEASGNAAWASLMQARKAVWEAGKSSSINVMIAASRHEAEKANKKARELLGDPQTFFSHVAAYLQSLSSDLAKASIHAGLSTTSPAIQQMNNDEAAASLSRSNSLSQRIKTGFDKKKLQAQTAVASMKVHAHRLARIAQHGHPTGTPTKAPEHVVADSVIRSILWQWQQPAIKIQYASAALLSKVDQLKKIEGVLAVYSAADGRESEQERSNTPVSPSGEEDLVAQVREWVNVSVEQENPENQRAAKVAALERLLGGDIDHAQSLLARLGSTTDSIQKVLEKHWMSVNNMLESRLPVDIALSLQEKVGYLVDKFMPDMARDLATAAQALNDAVLAAGKSARNFSEAKVQAGKAKLLATKVKERLSAESARLTERPLDDHSRGARLAKYWANLAKEQNVGNYPAPDAQQVLASLKEQGLLAETLSTGDPAGYLFATRLAGELENARNDELRLPMSPEQYAALEKGLVEYIVKWGQKRISRGVTRIVIELSFEQALDTVSFNVSNLFRLPYKVLKASIKIPYNVNKVNNYTMPGHDKPYKAIYGLLGKKLKQLGFNLLTAPVPGAIKLAAGAGLTTGAALHNVSVGRSENTFSAVYQHVAEGIQSEKIKMGSVGGMFFDSAFDSINTSTFREVNRQLPSQESKSDILNGKDKSKWSDFNLPYKMQRIDTRPFSFECASNGNQSLLRGRRETVNESILSDGDGDLQSGALSFEDVRSYNDFSREKKEKAYLYAMSYILSRIELDKSLPQETRYYASLARSGRKVLVPVDIYGYRLNNTLLLPDRPGSKSGLLILLDNANEYSHIGKGEDFSENIKWAMPYDADQDIMNPHPFIAADYNGMEALQELRSGRMSLDKGFNCKNPKPMDIMELSSLLSSTMEDDYRKATKVVTNYILTLRAIMWYDNLNASMVGNKKNQEITDSTLVDKSHNSKELSFDDDLGYSDFPYDKKELTYLYGIGYVLSKMESDNSLPLSVRRNATRAKNGESILVPVDIYGYSLNNTTLLPDSPGAKSGYIIRLDSEDPYYYVSKGSDIREYTKWSLPYYAGFDIRGLDMGLNGMEALQQLRSGQLSFEKEFNRKNPIAMTVKEISSWLVNLMDNDYKHRYVKIKNEILTSRALLEYGVQNSVGVEKHKNTSGDMLVDAVKQPGDSFINYNNDYESFSEEKKVATYLHAIKHVLLTIENDENTSRDIRKKAYLARIGGSILVPVDINGFEVNNAILLPEYRGSKLGVIIFLNERKAYKYIGGGERLHDFSGWDLPFNSDKYGGDYIISGYGQEKALMITTPSVIDMLDGMIVGDVSFRKNFNYNNPEPMDVVSISERLAKNLEKDYKLKKQKITNEMLITKAIAGSHIPEPGVSATEARYHIEYTWDNLSASEYTRSFARPFSTLSGQMQLIASGIKGETIQETESHVHQAEYIGSWIDASVGATTALTPAGLILNTAQSAADITADLIEGKDLEPWAVAGLVVGSIPGAKIATKVGAFNSVAGKTIKYGLLLGNKIIDLAIVERSIKVAVETGEPLAIYQALLASGMSVKNSYDMAKNMSLELKIKKNIESSASLEKLEVIQNKPQEYSVNSEMPVRAFRIGWTNLYGRINREGIEISRDFGVTWMKGSQLHLLAYRLQNSGGGRGLPDEARKMDPVTSESDTSQSERESNTNEPSTSRVSLIIEPINENASNDPTACRNAYDSSLKYRLGGRKAKNLRQGTEILIVEEELADETTGIAAFGKKDAEETGQGELIDFYNKIEVELYKTYQRFTSLHNIFNDPLRYDELIDQLRIILSVNTRSAKKYFPNFKNAFSLAMEQCKNIMDNDMDTVWITSGSNFSALTFYFDPLKRIFVDIDHSASFAITIPHEFSHLGNDTKDYFYHTDALGPIEKVRADANKAIVKGSLNYDDVVPLYWDMVKSDDEQMHLLERALEVESKTIRSIRGFINAYDESDMEIKGNVRKLIAETMIYDDDDVYIDMISDNADTFAHVFLKLNEHFGGAIDDGAAITTEGAASIVSTLAQSSKEN